MKLIKAAACAVLFFALPVSADFSAGFVVIAADDGTPEVGIWYPSLDDEAEERIGVFSAMSARRGRAADGLFPAVVMSHGVNGKYANHYRSAAALARAGYVVIAPQHTTDNDIISRKSLPAAITKRAGELKKALLAAYSHEHIGGMIDKKCIGALGYSLGGMTALMPAGATPDMREFIRHCRKYGDVDSGFCGRGLIAATMRKIAAALDWLKEKGVLNPKTDRGHSGKDDDANIVHPAPPIDFRAIVLVAPVGAAFTAEQVQNVNAAVALFRFGDDDVLKYPHHAEKLNALAGGKVKLYKTYSGVHHYAFIAPFPQRLLGELEGEDVEVAADPEGFDRGGFIGKINADIIAFFAGSL